MLDATGAESSHWKWPKKAKHLTTGPSSRNKWLEFVMAGQERITVLTLQDFRPRWNTHTVRLATIRKPPPPRGKK